MKATARFSLFLLPLLLAVAGCQSTPPMPGMKVGKPYVVDGKSYYPEYDPTYDKIGTASWYGPGFHGKYTASGEIFNQNDLTAAHPTLPMPSLVRVTNLTNGKSLIVRINDRGPFKSNRIIDLSKKAAQDLGIHSTSQVRVQFLKQETEQYLASLENGVKTEMVAYNTEATRRKNSSILHSTEPRDQIVEADVSTTHPGQTVSSAAPVVTVSAGDLPRTDIAKPVTLTREAPDLKAAPIEAVAASPKPVKSMAPLAMPATYATETPSIHATPAIAHSAEAPPKIAGEGKATGHFYIQAGSFASEENAHKLSSKLESIAQADVGKVEMGDKTWWRVRLGPYTARQDAADALDKVHQAGLPDARITQQ